MSQDANAAEFEARIETLETDTAGDTFVQIFATLGWRITSIWYSRQYDDLALFDRQQGADIIDGAISQ